MSVPLRMQTTNKRELPNSNGDSSKAIFRRSLPSLPTSPTLAILRACMILTTSQPSTKRRKNTRRLIIYELSQLNIMFEIRFENTFSNRMPCERLIKPKNKRKKRKKIIAYRSRFGSKLHGFVMLLNSFVYLYRVRQKERIPGTKKAGQAVSVNVYRIGKSAGRGFDLLTQK